MTNDLISRKALMQFPIRRDHYDRENGSEEFISGIETVLEYAESLPAVDAAPVVHGRWIEKQEATSWCDDDVFVFYECSVCHDQDGIYSDKFSYCPNCGARMNKEE